MYAPLSKTRLSSSTCVGCPLAGQASVEITSPGSYFSQFKVGISFAEVNGKQRKNTSLESHNCLFCQRRSLWFAVWEISGVAALCDMYLTALITEPCRSAVLRRFSLAAVARCDGSDSPPCRGPLFCRARCLQVLPGVSSRAGPCEVVAARDPCRGRVS